MGWEKEGGEGRAERDGFLGRGEGLKEGWSDEDGRRELFRGEEGGESKRSDVGDEGSVEGEAGKGRTSRRGGWREAEET